MGVDGDNLHGLGDTRRTLGAGRTGLTAMHPAVGGPGTRAIAARGPLTRHTLARGLLGGAEDGDFLAKLDDFGEQDIHGSFVKKRPEGPLRHEKTTFASVQQEGPHAR